ncbi:MAG: polyribonucleotide nucleotidyltransferase [Candidatus Brocadiales bacterium]
MSFKIEREVGGRNLVIEINKLARQASGSALVSYGDTMVLVVVVSGGVREGIDFFPLTVDYREKTYAAGKFPGGYFKREGKPTTKEVLTMRLIDRPIRPLFPPEYFNQVQITCTVLSADKENDPDMLALIGASAALSVSSIPFCGPIGSVRVGRVNEEFVVNPTHSELSMSDLNLVVAGTEDAVMMVEASSKELSEDVMIEAILFGHKWVSEIISLQRELLNLCEKPKQTVSKTAVDELLCKEITEKFYDEVKRKCFVPGKQPRQEALDELRDELIKEYCTDDNPRAEEGVIKNIFDMLERQAVRESIIKDKKRCDGRTLTDIRPVVCEVGALPRTHGSAIFTRGETQALVVATLGSTMDEQGVDTLEDEYSKKFMLHYNFPPYCVGEIKPVFGPSRREIGHGALAEKAIEAMLPPSEVFPYTVRIVSDILESNGSSSMATVCGGTLCLMDAGIPIKDPVAGIAMGLIKEDNEVAILSDILGVEDHLGDMDFKVAGTQRGITALQMDMKISGIDKDILTKALAQAKEGRIFILREMLKVIDKPRQEISVHAPRLLQIKIKTEKIGFIIGPGGKTIKKLQEETGARIEIEDDGTVKVFSQVSGNAEKARMAIEKMVEEIQIGKTYIGKVLSVKEYGAFVQVLPGQDGLVHISELSDGYVEKVESVVKVGEEIAVKVVGIDDQKRIKLSRKAAIKEQKEQEEQEEQILSNV